MCLYADKALNKATAQCSGLVGLHFPNRSLCPRTPSRRRQPPLHAVLLQETLPQQQSQVPSRSKGTSSTLQNSSSSQGGMSSFRPVLPMQQASSVEVHFQVQYGCEFGQHLSIIGTPQGWHVPAAVPMTWSEGNVWNAVLSVPAGTDIEYKYVVVWDDGNVVRWQDGPNNSLSVQHPGVLMHVQDTWSQRERSVREVGPRLNHDQHTKQSGGHSNGAAAVAAGSSSPQSPESSSAPKATAAGRKAEVLSSKDSGALPRAAGATAAVLPVQPAWGGVLQSHSLLFDQFDPAAAGEDDDLLQYEDEEEDQHWPAEMLQKAAAAAAASPVAPTGQAPASSQSQARAEQGSPAAKRSPTLVATPTADIMAAAAASHSKQTQLQQQQAAAANLAELLPMLRTELESALSELAKHPEAAQEHGHLLSEGQTVLAALQQQVAANSSSSSSSSSSKASSSRSPGRSPGATLTSGDEIAAALLSDDCEEACFCMVDAICSCADWDLNCACEADADTQCALPEDESAHAPAHTARQEPTAYATYSTPQAQPARASAHAPPMRAVSDMAPAGSYSRSSAAPSAVSVSELARAAALAARYDPAALAARDKSFTDVQEALQKSAQLLQALTDPCHPLVLEADRKLASASRQLHSGHLLN